LEEWARPPTIANFILIGLSAGLVLGCALAGLAGEQALLRAAGPWAFTVTWLAWATRRLSLRRNSLLRHKSSLQSATGIRSERLVQKSMGMSAGAFNTREFFHGASATALRHVRWGFQLLAFALPVLLMGWARSAPEPGPGCWLQWCRRLACWLSAGCSSPRPNTRRTCTTRRCPEPAGAIQAVLDFQQAEFRGVIGLQASSLLGF
jgi:hypothetical protein